MPFEWKTTTPDSQQTLRLWPHQSLSSKGFVAFILSTFVLILVPTLSLLGTGALWGLLPFVLLAVAGVYVALRWNHRARQIEETLILDDDMAHLTHRTAAGQVKEWQCNRYWAIVTKYDSDGPVPHYVTLRCEGREVEIGSFLSEDERIALFDDLQRNLGR
jgi:uncharacterized membrane protein